MTLDALQGTYDEVRAPLHLHQPYKYYSENASFLSEYSKLSPSQHGFQTGHSCQIQPLKSVPQSAEALNCNSSTYIIFL